MVTDPDRMPEAVDAPRLGTPPEPLASEDAPRARPQGPSRFETLLHRLGRDIERGEALVGGAERGRYATLDAGTLIALQAGIYRYSEAVDLTVKLVDRVTSAAKTVLESGR